VIDDMEAEGKIYCHCHPDPNQEATEAANYEAWNSEESRYEAEVTDEGIRLTCRHCGASTLIPTDSMLSAHAFLHADSVHLH
jgi:hypothetical protein